MNEQALKGLNGIISILDFYDKNPNIVFDKDHELTKEEVRDFAYGILKQRRRFQYLTEEEYASYSNEEIIKYLQQTEELSVNETVPEKERLQNFEEYKERFETARGDERAQMHLQVNEWIARQKAQTRQQDAILNEALSDTFNIPKEQVVVLRREIGSKTNVAEELTSRIQRQTRGNPQEIRQSVENIFESNQQNFTNNNVREARRDPAGFERMQIQNLKQELFGSQNAVVTPEQEKTIQQTVRENTQRLIAGDTNKPVKIDRDQLRRDLGIETDIKTELHEKIYLVSEDKQREIKLNASQIKAVRINVDHAESDPTNYSRSVSEQAEKNLNIIPEVTRALNKEGLHRSAVTLGIEETQKLLQLGRQLRGTIQEREEKISEIEPAIAQDRQLEAINNPNSPILAKFPLEKRIKIAEQARAAQTILAIKADLERMALRNVYGDEVLDAISGPRAENFREATEEEKKNERTFQIDLKQLEDFKNIYDKLFNTKVAVIEESEIAQIIPWYNPSAVTFFNAGEAVVTSASAAAGGYAAWQATNGLITSYATSGLVFPSGLPMLGSGAQAMSNEAIFSLIQASLGHEGPLLILDTAGNIIGQSLIGEGVPAALVWNGVIPTTATEGGAILAAAGTEAIAIGTAETATAAGLAVAGETAVTAGAGAATGVTAAGAGAAAASAIGLLATPVGAAIAGFIAVKVLPWIKRNLDKVLIALGGIATVFAIGTGNGLAAILGVGLIGGGAVAAAGGISGAGAALGSTILGFVGALGGAFVSAIAVPLAIALIGIPILVAFILFIINSGAYLVPPGSGSFSGGVPLPGPGGVACFVFSDEKTVWPENFKQNETEALNQLNGFSSKYSSLLCPEGRTITLYYGGNNGSVGGLANSPAGTITLYDAGLGAGVHGALYTIAHESGHIIEHYNGALYRSFFDTVPYLNSTTGEPMLPCTYPFPANPMNKTFAAIEGLAESIALYILGSDINNSCMGGQSLQQKYSENWQFVNSNLFN